jgi:chloramphenicol-sensitive protein RarD
VSAAAPPTRSTEGVVYALVAYGSWGVVPLYWKLMGRLPATELLAHRVVWSLIFLFGLLAAKRRLGVVWSTLRSAKVMKLLGLSAVLIAVNWGLFIWAVMAGRLVDASLGYFINPLANVVIGVALLRETLSRSRWIAVGLAGVGLSILLVSSGGSSLWVALSLASTFALYGLCRKLAPVDSIVGLFVETLLVAPIAIAFIAMREASGAGVLGAADVWLILLASFSGPVTAVPLASFAAAARRMPLSTLGFFQYISPSLQFLIAVFVFGEHVDGPRLVAFCFIWVALAMMSVTAIRDRSRGA